ncbi:MAG: hypothetical protein V3V53_04640 [Bacteroidales bacterium]
MAVRNSMATVMTRENTLTWLKILNTLKLLQNIKNGCRKPMPYLLAPLNGEEISLIEESKTGLQMTQFPTG